MEKAIHYKDMLDWHKPAGYTAAFITLTYDNQYIPYCYHDDFDQYLLSVDGQPMFEMPVYRDAKARYVRRKNKGHWEVSKTSKPIGGNLGSFLYVPDLSYDEKPKYFRVKQGNKFVENSEGKIAVLWYPDLQNFIKRLRIILNRNYGIHYNTSYFAIGEYGPTTSRSHFHVLFFCKQADYSAVKEAAVKAWPFADDSRTLRNISEAMDVNSYVSSYCNSTPYVKGILSAPAIYPKTFHSIHFGAGIEDFSFKKVFEKFRNRDFEYVRVCTSEDGAPTCERFPFPKYLISRYFPKIKGYSRLTNNEIFDIYRDPSRLRAYKTRLEYSDEDYELNYAKIYNHFETYLAGDPSLSYNFASLMATVYDSLFSYRLARSFDDVDTINMFYHYDNIGEFITGRVHNFSLYDYAKLHPITSDFDPDPNTFPDRVKKTLELTDQHLNAVKKSKMTNAAYAEKYVDF
jgi:hypothetical protein